MQLENKVAIVTGGASGLGAGISEVLVQRGADVIVADINVEGAQRVANELGGYDRKVKGCGVDVTKRSQIEEMMKDIRSEFHSVDILVNAAGVIGAPGFEDTIGSREEDWELTFSINVMGTVVASEVVSELMKEKGGGKIVNISSHSGRNGTGGNSAYGASKAAVIHLTQSFAQELAQHNINVNVVCPGTIWTPMWGRIAERTRRNDPAKSHLTGREIYEQAINRVCPLNREQTPEDIGKAVAFFASDDAINITGQSLNVNGGTRMH